MSNKKTLENNDLEKVSGGTYIKDGYKFSTIDEIRKFVKGMPVKGYKRLSNDYIADIGRVHFVRMINDTTAEFEHDSEYFTVGDNDIYFVLPYGY